MKKFKPKIGNAYFMINSRFEIKQTFHTGSEKSKKRIEVGNCFKTRGQANAFRSIIDDVISAGVPIPDKKPWWRIW